MLRKHIFMNTIRRWGRQNNFFPSQNSNDTYDNRISHYCETYMKGVVKIRTRSEHMIAQLLSNCLEHTICNAIAICRFSPSTLLIITSYYNLMIDAAKIVPHSVAVTHEKREISNTQNGETHKTGQRVNKDWKSTEWRQWRKSQTVDHT